MAPAIDREETMNGTTQEQRVVLHASDEPGDAAKALAAAAVLGAKLPTAAITVIVNGAALDGVLRGADELDMAGRPLVRACALGMQRRGIQAEQLQEGIATVPSAVVALAQAQLEGAAYIRI